MSQCRVIRGPPLPHSNPHHRAGFPPRLDLYKPSFAAGINVLGLDTIMPLVQISASHRGHDRRQAADPLNSGFDRGMFSPAIAFTPHLARTQAEQWARFPLPTL